MPRKKVKKAKKERRSIADIARDIARDKEKKENKRLLNEINVAIKSTDALSGLTEKDLEPVKMALDQQKKMVKLTPDMIKTLSNEDLIKILQERQGELKTLKVELISRVV